VPSLEPYVTECLETSNFRQLAGGGVGGAVATAIVGMIKQKVAA